MSAAPSSCRCRAPGGRRLRAVAMVALLAEGGGAGLARAAALPASGDPMTLGLALGQARRGEVELWAQLHEGECRRGGGPQVVTCRNLRLGAAHGPRLAGRRVEAELTFAADHTLQQLRLSAQLPDAEHAAAAVADLRERFAAAHALPPGPPGPPHPGRLLRAEQRRPLTYRLHGAQLAAEMTAQRAAHDRSYLLQQRVWLRAAAPPAS